MAMDVYPALTYRDVEAALVFLTTAFGLQVDELEHDEAGAVRSASLRVGEGRVLVQPDVPEELHGTHLRQGWVYVTVADADAHFARARDAGAQVLADPHGSVDGTFRGYSARDPEGNLWSFGTDRPGG
jgi:uncharacterized glyoxalase superfamily protein PhnB